MVDVTFPVALVVFDPDKHLISKNNSVVLGNTDNALSTDFFVFPNPVMSELQIQKPNDVTIYSIEILDVLGRAILTPVVGESINVESLASGLHFVRFETSVGMVNRTIIKN